MQFSPRKVQYATVGISIPPARCRTPCSASWTRLWTQTLSPTQKKKNPAQAILLHRIAIFYHDILVKQRIVDGEYDPGHLPNLTRFEGALDLLTFCNLMILANVLDSRTYEPLPGDEDSLLTDHDVNEIPDEERYEMAYARGRCLDILHWFFHKYEIFDKESGLAIDGFQEIGMGYLAHQGTLIIHFKKMATKNMKKYAPSPITTNAVSQQVALCFESYPDIPTTRHVLPGGEGNLAFPNPEKYGVRLVDGSEAYQCKHLFQVLGA